MMRSVIRYCTVILFFFLRAGYADLQFAMTLRVLFYGIPRPWSYSVVPLLLCPFPSTCRGSAADLHDCHRHARG